MDAGDRCGRRRQNSGLTATDDPEYYVLRKHAPDDTYLNSTGPVAQRTLSMVLRSTVPDAVLTDQVRKRISALDPGQPVEFQTMRSRLRDMAEQPRFNALLLVLFAGVGLFLAAVGLYGTLAFLVVERRQEIGIRVSVGATSSQIAGLMLSQSGKWALVGAGLGILGALAATRVLSSLLFQVSARDPLTIAGAVVVLLLVALIATLNPARKAASVDPMTVLRNG